MGQNIAVKFTARFLAPKQKAPLVYTGFEQSDDERSA